MSLFTPSSQRTRPTRSIPTVAPQPRHRRRRRLGTLPIIIAIILVALLIAAIVLWPRPSTSTTKQPTAPTKANTTAPASPTFQTVLPTGKTAGDLGGWHVVSPSGRDPVYAYRDILDGAPILVSQQPVPKAFASDPDKKLQEFASSFNATEKLRLGDKTIYIATDDKSQMVVFIKSNVLVMVRATTKHTTNSWTRYITTLTVTN